MTAADLLALEGTSVCAGTDVGSVRLARIRQPYLRARQFVFIAVLLNWWSKFACSLDVPPACQKRLCLLRGTKRHPSRSSLHCRHTGGRPPAENTFWTADWKPLRSFRW